MEGTVTRDLKPALQSETRRGSREAGKQFHAASAQKPRPQHLDPIALGPCSLKPDSHLPVNS